MYKYTNDYFKWITCLELNYLIFINSFTILGPAIDFPFHSAMVPAGIFKVILFPSTSTIMFPKAVGTVALTHFSDPKLGSTVKRLCKMKCRLPVFSFSLPFPRSICC